MTRVSTYSRPSRPAISPPSRQPPAAGKLTPGIDPASGYTLNWSKRAAADPLLQIRVATSRECHLPRGEAPLCHGPAPREEGTRREAGAHRVLDHREGTGGAA